MPIPPALPRARRPARAAPFTHALGLSLAVMLLAGCASVTPDQTLQASQQQLGSLAADLALQQGEADRAQARRSAQALLDKPLGADDAQRLALLNSPALQALLADTWADDIAGSASARPGSPRLAWERTVGGGGVELTRSLGLGLTDLLVWPARQQVATRQSQARRLALARQVLAGQIAVRQQWLRAVAARELRAYQQQVLDAADTSAELARRMHAVGSFNRLRLAREEAWQADAALRQVRATQAEAAEREALVRVLGLDDGQARQLQLPDRLPPLPPAAQPATDLAPQRLDIALARQLLQAREADAGTASQVASLLDLGATASRSRAGPERGRGLELELHLPLADGGAAQRRQRSARQLAAWQRLDQAEREAGSLLRERHAAYRAAFHIAHQARHRLVPLHQALLDETVLHYNGMLVGVFELLAQARTQVGSVITAIEAQRDFWLADAALQAAQLGVPANAGTPDATAAAPAADTGGH